MADAVKLITALALTSEGKLGGFIRRHLAGSAEVSEDRLRDAKVLLDAIAAALESPGDNQAWAKLKAAHGALDASGATVAFDEDHGIAGTVAIDEAPAGDGTLPFSPAQTVAELPDTGLGGADDHALAGGTVSVDVASGGDALPFGQHELSLEQYAALCAESARDPSHTAEVNARYGLGAPGARGRVDLAWQKKLARDPELRTRWRALFDKLKAEG